MKTALIVLDAQKIYTDPESEMYCEDSSKTITLINKLIKHFETNEDPIILVRHEHKLDGSDVGHLFDFEGEPEEDFNFKSGSKEVEYDDNLTIPSTAIEMIKCRYSAFQKTNLESELNNLKVNRIAVCGFMTNFCCESTAREALDRNFYVQFVLDATGTPGTENYNQQDIRTIVGELLGEGFANVLSTEEFISE